MLVEVVSLDPPVTDDVVEPTTPLDVVVAPKVVDDDDEEDVVVAAAVSSPPSPRLPGWATARTTPRAKTRPAAAPRIVNHRFRGDSPRWFESG
jgi:hypothetical protein